MAFMVLVRCTQAREKDFKDRFWNNLSRGIIVVVAIARILKHMFYFLMKMER